MMPAVSPPDESAVTAARTLTQRRRPHPRRPVRSGWPPCRPRTALPRADARRTEAARAHRSVTLTPSVPGERRRARVPLGRRMPRTITRIVIFVLHHGHDRAYRSSGDREAGDLMRGPHEAAADLESAIGGYWPVRSCARDRGVAHGGLRARGRRQGDPGAIRRLGRRLRARCGARC